MAIDVSALGDYLNEHAMELMTASVAKGRTADLVTVHAGMKNKDSINIMDTSLTLAADNCAFDAGDSTVFTQRVIAVSELKSDEALCVKDLNDIYLNLSLAAGSGDDSLPFEALYMEHKLAKLADIYEVADWQGDISGGAGNNAFYDGFIDVIDTAAASVDGNVGGVTVVTGITSANALDIVQGMYSVIPVEILGESDVLVFGGWDTFRALQANITDLNLFHYNADGSTAAGEIMIPGTGVKFVAVNGLTGTDRLFAGRTSNFHIGIDAPSDDSLEMWYSKDDRLVKSTIRSKRGTQVAFPQEIVQFTLV